MSLLLRSHHPARNHLVHKLTCRDTQAAGKLHRQTLSSPPSCLPGGSTQESFLMRHQANTTSFAISLVSEATTRDMWWLCLASTKSCKAKKPLQETCKGYTLLCRDPSGSSKSASFHPPRQQTCLEATSQCLSAGSAC